MTVLVNGFINGAGIDCSTSSSPIKQDYKTHDQRLHEVDLGDQMLQIVELVLEFKEASASKSRLCSTYWIVATRSDDG